MHAHTFSRLGTSARYRCDTCQALGHRRIGPGFCAGTVVVVLTCQKQLAGKKHCGKDAVFATGDRQASRCAEHAVKQEEGVSL